MIPEIRMAELLCTRLCHDLTGPIGAVNNGAEFLTEEGFDLQGQAVELISSSAAEAVIRLQFYRNAYGKVNSNGEANMAEVRQLVEKYLQSSKIQLDWPPNHAESSGISVSRKMAKLLINSMVVVAGALIRGGQVSIRLDQEGTAKTIKITASGSIVKIDPEDEAALKGTTALEMLTPKTVQPYLIHKLAEEIGAQTNLNHSPGFLEFILVKPVG
jgi:histidine phosphotransferase ChpT